MVPSSSNFVGRQPRVLHATLSGPSSDYSLASCMIREGASSLRKRVSLPGAALYCAVLHCATTSYIAVRFSMTPYWCPRFLPILSHHFVRCRIPVCFCHFPLSSVRFPSSLSLSLSPLPSERASLSSTAHYCYPRITTSQLQAARLALLTLTL